MIIKHLYQDAYNAKKTWLVCYMSNAMYLKQFIDGVQVASGRTTKKHIKEIGIFNFKRLN